MKFNLIQVARTINLDLALIVISLSYWQS